MRQRYLSPAIVITDTSHTSPLVCRPQTHSRARQHTFLRVSGVHTYSKYARRLTNQTVAHTRAPRTHTETLAHSALGWYVEDLVTQCLFNFKKLRQGWEHVGQQGHINLSKSYATSLPAPYAALQAIVFEDISPSRLVKGSRRPPCSSLALLLVCSIALITVSQTFFKIATLCMFLFICTLRPKRQTGKCWEEKKKKNPDGFIFQDHILAMAWEDTSHCLFEYY